MAGRREKLRRVGIIPEYRGFTPDGPVSYTHLTLPTN